MGRMCRNGLHDVSLPGALYPATASCSARCRACRRASSNAEARRRNKTPERRAYMKVYSPAWWAVHSFERELYNVTQLAKTRGASCST